MRGLLYLSAVARSLLAHYRQLVLTNTCVIPPGHQSAPSNLIGANGFAVGGRSLGRRGLCAVHATSGSTLDGALSRRKNRRHRWTGHPH
jgi:hypothetical protein